MLINANLYLANCDSVHGRSFTELKKRLLWALIFAERIIVTPNILIDNPDLDRLFALPGVKRYLQRNPGKIILRHNHSREKLSLRQYFTERDDDFLVSSHPGRPRKGNLASRQLSKIHNRLESLDELLDSFGSSHDNVHLHPDSLSNEIIRRLSPYMRDTDANASKPAITDADINALLQNRGLHSRSAWYRHLEQKFPDDPKKQASIRTEIVDPAYNSLFVRTREAFASDHIRLLNMPGQELVVSALSVEPEIRQLNNILKIVRFIHTLGTDGVVSWIADAVKDKLAEYVQERGREFITANRTWRNMYDTANHFIGIEIVPESPQQ